jgi:hypothetical protein
VKQEQRIRQIANHLPREPRSILVMIGQQTKALIQAPAMLARVEQRDVKRRQPSLFSI